MVGTLTFIYSYIPNTHVRLRAAAVGGLFAGVAWQSASVAFATFVANANYGAIYSALVKLEQEGSIASEWGAKDNNRKAKYYKLTRAGRKRLAQETQKWETTTAILARFFAPPQGY